MTVSLAEVPTSRHTGTTPRAYASAEMEEMPLERLETMICSASSRIAAITFGLLSAIAVYDKRKGWEGWECRSMVSWLTWKAGMSRHTAAEHVRVAHALEALPLIRDELEAGRLSYSQVRAITRVAVPATEADLVSFARSMTAASLERLVSTYHRLRASISGEAEQARHARRGLWSHVEEDGSQVIVLRLPPDQGAGLLRAVEAEARASGAAGDDRADDPLAAKRADALSALVERGVDSADTAASVSRAATVVVHVDEEVLAATPGSEADGSCWVQPGGGLSAETALRLACDATVVYEPDRPQPFAGEPHVEGGQSGREACAGDGLHRAPHPDDSGRRTRRVGQRLRRALARRDGGCVFPGCDHAGRTHAHHVVHWAHGGRTDLDNLASLCGFHHRRVHEGGYRLGRTEGGGWLVRDSEGKVAHRREVPLDPLDDTTDPPADPYACHPDWMGDRVDAGWITEGLLLSEQRAIGPAAAA